MEERETPWLVGAERLASQKAQQAAQRKHRLELEAHEVLLAQRDEEARRKGACECRVCICVCVLLMQRRAS